MARLYWGSFSVLRQGQAKRKHGWDKQKPGAAWPHRVSHFKQVD
jgi:hypothetical protein